MDKNNRVLRCLLTLLASSTLQRLSLVSFLWAFLSHISYFCLTFSNTETIILAKVKLFSSFQTLCLNIAFNVSNGTNILEHHTSSSLNTKLEITKSECRVVESGKVKYPGSTYGETTTTIFKSIGRYFIIGGRFIEMKNNCSRK